MFTSVTVTRLTSHTIFPYSYNAIKGYVKEGRQTELTATEHLVSAAQAGQSCMYLNTAALLTHSHNQHTVNNNSQTVLL